MTKVFARKPHPARRARIATAGISSTAFLAIISSFAWNTHVAELAASTTEIPVTDPTTATVTTTGTDVTGAGTTATPSAAPTVATAPADTATTTATTTKKKKKAKAATSSTSGTTSTATTTAPADASTTSVTPAAPAAPTVVYTCKSPGGKTENPTSKGTCKNAKHGYVLTQI